MFSFKTLATYLTSNLVWRGERKDRIVYFSCAWLRLENRYKNKTYTQKESERKAKKRGGNLISGCPSWGAGFAVTRVSGKPMGFKLVAAFFDWSLSAGKGKGGGGKSLENDKWRRGQFYDPSGSCCHSWEPKLEFILLMMK